MTEMNSFVLTVEPLGSSKVVLTFKPGNKILKYDYQFSNN